jgi:hypothetical protein
MFAAGLWLSPYAESLDVLRQCGQSCLDVLEPGVFAPVTFGRKVDDISGRGQPSRLKDQHSSRLHLAGSAGALIDSVLRFYDPLNLPL